MQEDRQKVAKLLLNWHACVSCSWPILSRYSEPMCSVCLDYIDGWN